MTNSADRDEEGQRLSTQHVLAQVKKVANSQEFAAADQLKGMLRFICSETLAGRSSQLKAYVIGVDVFGRASDFDSQAESIVRVQAGQLRLRLKNYYASEGRDDAILIDVPKGGYVPRFSDRATKNSLSQPHPTASELEKKHALPTI